MNWKSNFSSFSSLPSLVRRKYAYLGQNSTHFRTLKFFSPPIHPFWVVMDSRGQGNLKKVICRQFCLFCEKFCFCIFQYALLTQIEHKIKYAYFMCISNTHFEHLNFGCSNYVFQICSLIVPDFHVQSAYFKYTLWSRQFSASFPSSKCVFQIRSLIAPVFRQFSTFKVRIWNTQKKHYLFHVQTAYF